MVSVHYINGGHEDHVGFIPQFLSEHDPRDAITIRMVVVGISSMASRCKLIGVFSIPVILRTSRLLR
jgi:hypothetical protein